MTTKIIICCSPCTLVVHHRQGRHPPLHKYGEGVVERRRLPNGGDVPERSDAQLLDLLPEERGLGNFLPLQKKQTSKTPQQKNIDVPPFL